VKVRNTISAGVYNFQPSEYFKQSWSKPKTQHLSPNIMEMTKIFNRVSNWVATCIIMEQQVRDRAFMVTYMIKLAQVVFPNCLMQQQLYKLQNYHILTAVISGLSNSAVLRLKWTFKKVPKRLQQVQLWLCSNCYRAYHC